MADNENLAIQKQTDPFNIDFKRLVLLWLPTFLRRTVLAGFSFVLVAPLETMYVEFLKMRKQNLIKMDHNYQKFSMQKRLNNAFDNQQRRIRIVNSISYFGVYIYTEAEDDQFKSKTQWLYGDENPIYLRNESELNSDYDFIVEIPNEPINMYQLKAEIDFYALQSKRYLIKII